MAEETAKAAAPAAPAAEAPGRKPKKKKSRPTNCVQSNKRIRRKDWYYRNGKYFANKKAFKLFAAAELEKARKAKEAAEAAAAKAAEPPAAEQKTA
jgi:hypothetical protein